MQGFTVFLGNRPEGLECEGNDERLEERQGLLEPATTGFRLLSHGQPQGFDERLRGGKLGDKSFRRMRAQPGGDAPAGDLLLRLVRERRGAETAAAHAGQQGIFGIEEFEVRQYGACAAAGEPGTESAGFTCTLIFEPAGLDGQQGHASARLNVGTEEIDQRLVADIEQGRMEEVVVLRQLGGRLQLGLQTVIVDDGLAQTLKARAVIETQCGGQAVVGFLIDLGLIRRQRRNPGAPGDDTQLQNPPGGMERPRILAQALPTLDLEAAVPLVELETEQSRVLAVEDHGGDDVHLFERQRLSAQPFTGGRQRHFGIGRAGEDDGAPYLMVGEPGQDRRIEGVFPSVCCLGNPPTQERMHAPPFDGQKAFAGARVPMPLALPGVVGQLDTTPGLREIDA